MIVSIDSKPAPFKPIHLRVTFEEAMEKDMILRALKHYVAKHMRLSSPRDRATFTAIIDALDQA